MDERGGAIPRSSPAARRPSAKPAAEPYGAISAFDALADPTRRDILLFLADGGESPAGAIAAGVCSVGRTAVSSHLRVLRVAGLVSERRDGRFRLYSVESEAADAVVRFLAALYRRPLADLWRQLETDRAGPGKDAPSSSG